MRSPIAVIAAGGYGKRLGYGVPKSLIMCEGDPMISHVLRSFANAGVDRFIIFNDRPEFDHQLRVIGSGFSAAVMNDEGVDSTIALARRAMPLFADEDFLFAYGHAPRPASFLRRLLAAHADVTATGVWSSSKTSPIRSRQGFWIEPPYRIHRSTLQNCSASCWGGFFDSTTTEVVPVMISEPGEFNYSADLRLYRPYVRNLVLGDRCSELHSFAH